MAQAEQAQAETVRPVVSNHAQACLTGLQQTGERPRAEAALRAGQVWGVLVIAFPTQEEGEGERPPTQCEQDCLALLAQAGKPLSGVRVCRELDKRGLGVYGVATVKRALARLKRKGLISKSRTSPRGYFLPEALPLYQHLASL